MNIPTQNLKALVLNATYQPVDMFPLMAIPCIPAALTRCYQAKPTCDAVIDWPVPVKTRRGNWNYNYPSVIARRNTNIYHREGVIMNHEPLFYRDRGKCAYCGDHTPIYQNGDRWGTIDHVWPRSLGGKDIWENVVWACKSCNSAKDNKEPKGQWKPQWQPWVPDYWDLVKIRREFPLFVQDIRWMDFLPEWKGKVNVTVDLNG